MMMSFVSCRVFTSTRGVLTCVVDGALGFFPLAFFPTWASSNKKLSLHERREGKARAADKSRSQLAEATTIQKSKLVEF